MTDPGRRFVVANPVSGGGRARRYWPKLAAALGRQGVTHDFACTRGAGDGARLVADAIARGHRRLLALGGDGSFNDLVRGLFAAGAPPANCIAAVAALGTGNDWARAMQVPNDPDRLAACMARAAARAVDFGIAEDAGGERRAVFHNVAGAGLDAEVLGRTRRRGPRALAYLARLARTIGRFRAPRFAIRANDADVSGDYWLASVAIGPRCGGGMRLAPRAAIDAQPACGVQVDGQAAGRTPVRFRLLPAALRALDCRDSAE